MKHQQPGSLASVTILPSSQWRTRFKIHFSRDNAEHRRCSIEDKSSINHPVSPSVSLRGGISEAGKESNVAAMNDSFLEDLELDQVETRPGITARNAERNITRRRSQPLPLPLRSEQDGLNPTKQRAKEKAASASTPPARVSCRKSEESGVKENVELRRPYSRELKPESSRSKTTERRSVPENKLKLAETAVQTEVGKKKLESKEQHRWSAGSNKETSRRSDGSSKENSRPSDSSRDSVSASESTTREQMNRGSGDTPSRKNASTEIFEVGILNSVKEIIGTYTKNESTKILKAMQTLYINSQANLIKLMLQQTEEIVNDANLVKESPRLRSLIDENESLRNDVALLVSHNEELRRAVEESEQIKKENVQLKLRCKELTKSSSSNASKENSRPSVTPLKETASSRVRTGKLLELCRNSK